MVRRGPEAVYDMVRRVPSGHVTGYGALGQALDHHVSGLVVGNWMSRCPDDVPWWRVVAKDGRLVIFKRDAGIAIVQRKLLEGEGVEFIEDRVDVARFYWEPR